MDHRFILEIRRRLGNLASSELKVQPYDPFGRLPGRYFTARRPESAFDEYLIRAEGDVVEAIWKLPPNGQKPGHGLFLAEHLEIGRAHV